MLYLDPEDVLERLSKFAIEEVRPAIRDDERFVKAQVGSMASTLRFLSGELAALERSMGRQEQSFREALADVDARIDKQDRDLERIRNAISDSRAELATAENSLEREEIILEDADDILSLIDANVDDHATACTLREPFYGFLDTRVNAQLQMLGRDAGEVTKDDE